MYSPLTLSAWLWVAKRHDRKTLPPMIARLRVFDRYSTIRHYLHQNVWDYARRGHSNREGAHNRSYRRHMGHR